MSYVHNAFTFTPQGGKITIDVQATPSEVRFRVSDTGIGIESDKLERIFEEFYQVEDHMIRHHGGLGIGLSITRAIATAHRGRAWAESDGLGKGATFYLALPRLT